MKGQVTYSKEQISTLLANLQSNLNTTSSSLNNKLNTTNSKLDTTAASLKTTSDSVTELSKKITVSNITIAPSNWVAETALEGDPGQKNKWKLERFASSVSRTFEAIDGRTGTVGYYADTSISASMNVADSYMGVATTWVYVDEARTESISTTTDDAGTIYLNRTQIGTTASCTAKTITYPFVKGWNEVTIMYTEGSGGDGFVLSPKLSSCSWVKSMSALRTEVVSGYYYVQTLKPTEFILGADTSASNITINPVTTSHKVTFSTNTLPSANVVVTEVIYNNT